MTDVKYILESSLLKAMRGKFSKDEMAAYSHHLNEFFSDVLQPKLSI